MGSVRAQGILLPFYPKTELMNDTANNTFVRKAELGTSLGCQVCFDSECQHDGYCSDPAQIYTCSCEPGFEGDVCEVNIDECVENDCTNDAICVDGINNYTCSCQPGYEGRL